MDEKLKEFKPLHNKLMKFKNKLKFKKLGFGIGGPYNKWLKRVQELRGDAKIGTPYQELEQLGLTYAGTEGQENLTTKFYNEKFKEECLL